MIESFSGKYRFLSNFWLVPVRNTFDNDGILYPSVEHAYQAAKTLDMEQRNTIARNNSAAEAKKIGRTLELRNDVSWDVLKFNIMYTLLDYKFQLTKLGAKLAETGNEKLVEKNYWHDNLWGMCSCLACSAKTHHNTLGRMLMNIRLRRQIEMGIFIP